MIHMLSQEELTAMMAVEERRLGVGSKEFMQRHNDVGNGTSFKGAETKPIKGAYAESFTEWRKDNAETVESRDTVFAV